MSTPGQSISGAEGVREAGWVTPGVAEEKKLEIRLPHPVEFSDKMLDEQPETRTALATSPAA
jgi:hypothetical protein